MAKLIFDATAVEPSELYATLEINRKCDTSPPEDFFGPTSHPEIPTEQPVTPVQGVGATTVTPKPLKPLGRPRGKKEWVVSTATRLKLPRNPDPASSVWKKLQLCNEFDAALKEWHEAVAKKNVLLAEIDADILRKRLVKNDLAKKLKDFDRKFTN